MDARTLFPAVHRRVAVLVATALVAAAVAHAEPEVEVKVERVKPHADKHPTLRFLKENRAFLRAALDRTREKPLEYHDSAAAIDPRFLAYRELIAKATSDGDSVALADAARQRRDLLESVTELGDLEAQLDQFDRLLVAQRERLAVLQRDFTGDQRTALAVVLTGYPARAELSHVTLALDDSSQVDLALTPDQCAALKQGGAVQVFHGYVEPREQVFRIALPGVGSETGDAGWVTLDPTRDRLTMLRLDLSQVEPADGAVGLHATTWLNDAQAP